MLSDGGIRRIVLYINEHFLKVIIGISFNAILATNSKKGLVRYLKVFWEIRDIKCCVVISPPNTREGNNDTYCDDINNKEYEPLMQKLLDSHMQVDGILKITEPICIPDKEKFKIETENLTSDRAKAIEKNKYTDPNFYAKFYKKYEKCYKYMKTVC